MRSLTAGPDGGLPITLRVHWLDPAPSPGAALDAEFNVPGFGFGDARGLDAPPPPSAGDAFHYNTAAVAATPDAGVPDELLFSADCLDPRHAGTVLRVRDEEAGRYLVCTVAEVRSARHCRVLWHGPHLPAGRATPLWEEQAASEVRGYFRSVCVYQQRLVFGGARDAGSTLFLSRSGRFRDFGLGEGKDDDAVAVQAAGGVRTVRHVVGDGPHLSVFTENGVSYVPVDKGKPLTPGTIRLEKVAPYGAADARPGAFDGGVLFVLNGGAAVRDLNYNSEAENAQADPVSLPATGFLRTLTDAAYLSASNERPEELAFFCNAAGRIVVFHSIRGQKIGAWFEWDTAGSWSAVAVAGQRLFAVCSRVPGTWALEMFDHAVPFDGAVRWRAPPPPPSAGRSGAGGAPNGPTAFDPAAMAPPGSIALSREGLDATGGGPTRQDPQFVRTNHGSASGKLFFQAAVGEFTSGGAFLGLCPAKASFRDLGGGVSVGYHGYVAFGGDLGSIRPTAAEIGLANNRLVEVAVDVGARLFWARTAKHDGSAPGAWNGAAAADPATGAGGISLAGIAPGAALHAFVSFGTSRLNEDFASFNFGTDLAAVPWAGAGPPAGFVAFGRPAPPPPAAPPPPLRAPHLPDGSRVHAADDALDYLGDGALAGGAATALRQEGELGDHGTGAGWAGLAFDWWIDPLPPAIDLPDGSLLQRTQRLVRTSLRLLGARSAAVGSESLVLRADGMEASAAPDARSDWWMCRHLGWARPGGDNGAALVPRITRDAPLPVAVLAMKREIKA